MVKNVRKDVIAKLNRLYAEQLKKDPKCMGYSYHTPRADHWLHVGDDGNRYYGTVGYDGTKYNTII